MFGSMGYLFCLLQWFWAVLLYFSLFQSAISFTLTSNDPRPESVAHPTVALPSQLEMGIVVVMTVVILAATLYALVKMPKNIAKAGSKLVHQTADAVAPAVIKAQHKKDTKKVRMKLAPKLTAIAKVLLIVIPMITGAFSGLLETLPIDYSIAVIVGIILGSGSALFFLVQYAAAHVLRIRVSDLW